MSAPSAPLVSVCIPAYKGAVHLPATIDSVLGQTLGDFELIVIDDHSPDATAEVVSQFKDPRIRCLRNPSNLGPEGNWNRCLREARGRYFKLLPQDDLLYPDTLRRQVDVLDVDKDESIAIVFGARNIIDADGRVLMRRGYRRAGDGVVRSRDLLRWCVRLGGNLIGEPGGVLLRKSLADRVGGFSARFPYVIDLEYWSRLLAHGAGYYLADPVVAFRVSPGSWSVAIGRGQSRDFRGLISKLAAEPGAMIGAFDVSAGNAAAVVANAMRLTFYRFALRARK